MFARWNILETGASRMRYFWTQSDELYKSYSINNRYSPKNVCFPIRQCYVNWSKIKWGYFSK